MNNNILDFANQYGEKMACVCNWCCVLRTSLLIILGIVLTLIPFVFDVELQWVVMACIILGPCLVIVGAILLLYNYSELRYLPTDSIVTVNYNYVSPDKLPLVESILTSSDIALGSRYQIVGSGQLRIDTLSTSDHSFCMCMIFQYVPYCYAPVYGPYVIDRELTLRLSQL